jgi:N-acyl-D-amino-acid deacylase
MQDLVFREIAIYDGSGKEPFVGDLAVEGEKITSVATPTNGNARRVIDGQGLALAPGFIDIHGHSDYYLLINPTAEAKVRQGITTDVGGNCGYAAAPISGPEAEERCKLYREQFGLELPFNRLQEYLQHVEDVGISVNYAHLIGHNTVRASVMGGSDRPATPDDMAQMETIIEEGMEEGAFGLSTGLVYAPACFADRTELTTLCRASARRGGLLATHMRSEGAQLLEAIEEVIGVAREAGLPLQISHLKTAGEGNWDKLDAAFELIEEARAHGQDVTCDRYPYIASNTHLSALLPDWVHDGQTGEKISRLRDTDSRARVRSELEAKYSADYWNNVLISRVLTESNKACEGKRIAEIAEKKGVGPIEAMMDLLAEEKLQVEILIFMMNEENMRRILRKDYVMVGSDAGALTHEPPLGVGKPHPRNFGTFPAVLGNLARDEGILSLAEAVRKMTSSPCHRLGIRDRGFLAPGMKADLVLFDPEAILDRTTYEEPIAYPDGIRMVMINGQAVVDNGEHTGARPGRALRKQGQP